MSGLSQSLSFGLSRALVDGEETFDSNAAAYFAAVEAAGGSFDLSSISGTYTASYVKSAHNTLVTSLKSSGVWAKTTEILLLVGKNSGDGLVTKLKGSGAATLVNFVLASDYVAAGSGAGLIGDGSSKYVDFGTNVGDPENISMGSYLTGVTDTDGGYFMAYGAPATCSGVGYEITGNLVRWFDTTGTNTGTHTTGYYNFTKRSATDTEGYIRAVSTYSSSVDRSGYIVDTFRLHTLSGLESNARIALGHHGSGMTLAEVQSANSAFDTFLDAIGAKPF